MIAVESCPELRQIREHMIVDGKPSLSGIRKVAVYDPATGNVIAQQIKAGPAQLDTEPAPFAHVNDTPYSVSASIWSNDLSRVDLIIQKNKAGVMWFNTQNIADPNLPFGGYEQSGFGREHGCHAIGSFLETKSVVLRIHRADRRLSSKTVAVM